MDKKVLILLSMVVVITFIFTSCKDTVNNQNIDDIEIPATGVSYARYIQPVFDFKCATIGCHDDGTARGGLKLTSWQAASTRFDVINPGNPDNSILVQRIEGRVTAPMPPPGNKPLTANQIKGVRTWILEGAKNN